MLDRSAASEWLPGSPRPPTQIGHPTAEIRLGFGESLQELLEAVPREVARLKLQDPSPSYESACHEAVHF
jgi:hypothetical protein